MDDAESRPSFSDLAPSPSGPSPSGSVNGSEPHIERSLSSALARRRHTRTRSVPQYATTGKSTSCSSTCLPLQVGVHSIQNCRETMEDAHRSVVPEEGEQLPDPRTPGGSLLSRGDVFAKGEWPAMLGFFGVFDGHGGSNAADFAESHLFEKWVGKWHAKSMATSAEEAMVAWMREAILETEEALVERSREQDWMDGTTVAAVVLLEEPGGRLRVVAGNVGDSEILLGRLGADGSPAPILLSELHNMSRNEDEKRRVEAVGGRIYRGRLGHPRFNPQFASIAVTRALGDLFFKDRELTEGRESGLTAEPFVICEDVLRPVGGGPGPRDAFLLLGCDGFFDVVKYQEAVEFVFERFSGGEQVQAISEALVELAQRRGSTDNITVLLVKFGP
eukprot:TRINITY_DN25046_c0_g1_i1.p1 TRINITY_DN25046_c0_g1~~TRINITY_DN25046_c0_g1_i1.p1  ORF type:complete len:403 (+),score=49.24 TRINITY_DN25046_c0_g1_i1:40-1209(+)